jgi:hypothetical protein
MELGNHPIDKSAVRVKRFGSQAMRRSITWRLSLALSLGLAFCVGCRKREAPPAATTQTAPSSSLQAVSIKLGNENQEQGLTLRLNNDGITQPAVIDGAECRLVQRVPGMNVYFYFAIDPAFKWAEVMDVAIAVEYYDNDRGYFLLQYDASNTNTGLSSAYVTVSETEPLTGSGTWKKGFFLARKARFRNAQNAQSDFRLEVHAPQLFVRRVAVIRLDVP